MGLKSKSSESYSSLRPQQTAPQTHPRPYPRPRPCPAQRSRCTSLPARGNQRQGTNPNPMPSARGTQQRSTGSSQSTEDTARDNSLMNAAFWRRAREKTMASHGNRHNDTKRFSLGPNELSKSFNNDYCKNVVRPTTWQWVASTSKLFNVTIVRWLATQVKCANITTEGVAKAAMANFNILSLTKILSI